IDLVAMVVDDLVSCGAEPLFMTDYVVFGRLNPERAAAVVAGVAEGCVRAGCALIGGETAEHPGHLGPDDFDLAGAATGVVEADALLGPDRVQPGDAVLALASSGLHANGYSLVRRGVAEAGPALGGAPGRAWRPRGLRGRRAGGRGARPGPAGGGARAGAARGACPGARPGPGAGRPPTRGGWCRRGRVPPWGEGPGGRVGALAS